MRGLWLTSVLGSVLLVMLPIVIITGLLSYIAYGPQFGQAIPGDVGWLKLPTFDWPTEPAWIYRLNQGLHVGLGLILIPVVLAKLWSVIPRLFVWPPARSIAQVLERISLLMLVGGMLFEIITGVLNIQYDYIFGFSFYTAHYYGAWVFIAGFVIHIAIKIPQDVDRPAVDVDAGRVAHQPSRHRPRAVRAGRAGGREPVGPDDQPPGSARAGRRRRAVHGAHHGGADPRRLHPQGGTAASAWPHARRRAQRLPGEQDCLGGGHHTGRHRRRVAAHPDRRTVEEWCSTAPTLRAMPQHTARLPIACVEGWSTTETWTGVRLPSWPTVRVSRTPRRRSCDRSNVGAGSTARPCRRNQVIHPDSLLALRVNGADLSPDHGYPARIIVPGLPGVHNTKWVASIDFRAG